VPDGLAFAAGIRATVHDLNIKLVIGVDLFNHSGPDAQDFKHACCCSAEYDDSQDHND
jgi:hypothetical protein